jgi:hypothetical protein
MEEERRIRLMKGRQSTILTGTGEQLGTPQLKKTTLLGGEGSI